MIDYNNVAEKIDRYAHRDNTFEKMVGIERERKRKKTHLRRW